MTDPNLWRHCSSCRGPLRFNEPYWECSVSTCSRNRTALFFCSVSCWDAHLPGARHREAWAVEKRAPSRGAWERQQVEEAAAEKAREERVAVAASAPRPAAPVAASEVPAGPLSLSNQFDKDVLVVVSKLKKYIKDRSGMNTSDGVIDVLSEHLRHICDEAVHNAHQDNRRTVMDRDMRPVTGRWRVVR